MISGHTDITQEDFDKYYKPAIDATPHGSCFVVGTAEGADSFAIQHIKTTKKGSITICSKSNNHGLVEEDNIKIVSGFNSFPERDAYMTSNSDQDIAFLRNDWMALGSGTMANLIRRQYGNQVSNLFKNKIRKGNCIDSVLLDIIQQHPEVDSNFVKMIWSKSVMGEQTPIQSASGFMPLV
jgi:hypothetical protein